jgi:hypothetical protein
LLRFDGLEPSASSEVRARLSGPFSWAARHQRAAGAFATAALVLIVSIPLGILTIEESRPGSITTAEKGPSEQPGRVAVDAADELSADVIDVAKAQPDRNEPVLASAGEERPSLPREALPSRAKGSAFAASEVDTTSNATPPQLGSAPAAPAPAAPSNVADQSEGVQLAENAGADEVVVTGSRIRPPQGSPSSRAAVQSSPLAVVDELQSFVIELRTALGSGNHRSVLQLTALPLKVHYPGGTVTYRKASEVERNFERIFTQAVRASLVSEREASLSANQTVIVGRVAIARPCKRSDCRPATPLRVISVTPE